MFKFKDFFNFGYLLKVSSPFSYYIFVICLVECKLRTYHKREVLFCLSLSATLMGILVGFSWYKSSFSR